MSHDKKEILCTIGPSSLNEWTINRLQSLGVSLFRINLSHTSLEDLPVFIHTITENSDVPICLDTEGAQIRTSDFQTRSIIVKDNSKINIFKNITEGDRKGITLYPDTVWDQINIDDLLTIDFDSVLARVISKEKTTIKIRILNGGEISPNKAVTSRNGILLPPLTKKDKQAIQICSQLQIKHYALSFVHQAADIDELKRYVPKDSIIMSKIECSQAILNLDNIINKSDINTSCNTECPICNDEYKSHQAIRLNCNHKVCRDCLLRLFETGTLRCPLCREPISTNYNFINE